MQNILINDVIIIVFIVLITNILRPAVVHLHLSLDSNFF